ncbi:hypothetical protein [Alkalicoccus daliensis]|uniref:Uncharacterized protein n=1 Tax=Alkalicoccus daliensis TaxID=745820 RepID=A0A1H0B6G1_9BACI|nr:hypothetical protein [Alkalicoccus daliensis]SDN40913.1 hypothetical protein SAMN04488053_101762 [Alkalicoccus daliensis]
MTAPSFFVSIYSQLLFVGWLITAGGIYWGLDKRAGFQLLYLTILSLSLGYIIVIYFPFIYLSNENVLVTHPHIQASVTLFAFLLPLCKRRRELVICIAAPLIISLLYLLMQGIPAFTVSGGILIGGFVSYSFYRSLEWLGAMPDFYLFTFAIILPFFISALIYPEAYFLLFPGLLLGIGIGASLEQYKIRMNIEATARKAKIIAFLVGSGGIVFSHAAVRPVFSIFPAGELISGVFTGLWITLMLPFIMLAANLYEKHGKSEQIV